MTEDDRAVMARLAALEAEVKADSDAKRARKEAALAKLREQRAAQEAERQELRARQAALVTKQPRPVAARDEDADHGGDLGGAIELARRAHGIQQELTRAPKQGDKSWVKSAVASTMLGPIGWLYAGSMREAVPASAAWLGFAVLATKFLPMFLLFPVLLVALPLSGVAGLLYAYQYNRTGSRQRLFGDSSKKKQLPSG